MTTKHLTALALLALLPLGACTTTQSNPRSTAPQSGYSYSPGTPTLQNMDGEPRSYGDGMAGQPAGRAKADQR